MQQSGDGLADRPVVMTRRRFGGLMSGLCVAILVPAAPRIAAAQSDTASGTVVMLDPPELAAGLSAKDFTLINVHIPYDGEIAATDSFIPFDKIADNLALLPADKSAPVVVYCRSGAMSAIAAQTLVDLGYTQVADLSGGMNAWSAQGFDLLRN